MCHCEPARPKHRHCEERRDEAIFLFPYYAFVRRGMTGMNDLKGKNNA
jgi:hypothetical protein